MRKIISKEESRKKSRRNQWIIGIILAFIMVFSVVGFSVGNTNDSNQNPNGNNIPDKIIYNGFEFNYVEERGQWQMQKDGINFLFKNTPRDVESLLYQLNGTTQDITSYQNMPLYFSSESDAPIYEILLNLDQFSNIVQEACLDEKDCKNNELPIKDCSNNFIIIKEANESSISQQEKCTFIEGPSYLLTELADIYLFKVLKIQ